MQECAEQAGAAVARGACLSSCVVCMAVAGGRGRGSGAFTHRTRDSSASVIIYLRTRSRISDQWLPLHGTTSSMTSSLFLLATRLPF